MDASDCVYGVAPGGRGSPVDICCAMKLKTFMYYETFDPSCFNFFVVSLQLDLSSLFLAQLGAE
jgi:hypothetical protein